MPKEPVLKKSRPNPTPSTASSSNDTNTGAPLKKVRTHRDNVIRQLKWAIEREHLRINHINSAVRNFLLIEDQALAKHLSHFKTYCENHSNPNQKPEALKVWALFRDELIRQPGDRSKKINELIKDLEASSGTPEKNGSIAQGTDIFFTLFKNTAEGISRGEDSDWVKMRLNLIKSAAKTLSLEAMTKIKAELSQLSAASSDKNFLYQTWEYFITFLESSERADTTSTANLSVLFKALSPTWASADKSLKFSPSDFEVKPIQPIQSIIFQLIQDFIKYPENSKEFQDSAAEFKAKSESFFYEPGAGGYSKGNQVNYYALKAFFEDQLTQYPLVAQKAWNLIKTLVDEKTKKQLEQDKYIPDFSTAQMCQNVWLDPLKKLMQLSEEPSTSSVEETFSKAFPCNDMSNGSRDKKDWQEFLYFLVDKPTEKILKNAQKIQSFAQGYPTQIQADLTVAIGTMSEKLKAQGTVVKLNRGFDTVEKTSDKETILKNQTRNLTNRCKTLLQGKKTRDDFTGLASVGWKHFKEDLKCYIKLCFHCLRLENGNEVWKPLINAYQQKAPQFFTTEKIKSIEDKADERHKRRHIDTGIVKSIITNTCKRPSDYAATTPVQYQVALKRITDDLVNILNVRKRGKRRIQVRETCTQFFKGLSENKKEFPLLKRTMKDIQKRLEKNHPLILSELLQVLPEDLKFVDPPKAKQDQQSIKVPTQTAKPSQSSKKLTAPDRPVETEPLGKHPSKPGASLTKQPSQPNTAGLKRPREAEKTVPTQHQKQPDKLKKPVTDKAAAMPSSKRPRQEEKAVSGMPKKHAPIKNAPATQSADASKKTSHASVKRNRDGQAISNSSFVMMPTSKPKPMSTPSPKTHVQPEAPHVKQVSQPMTATVFVPTTTKISLGRVADEMKKIQKMPGSELKKSFLDLAKFIDLSAWADQFSKEPHECNETFIDLMDTLEDGFYEVCFKTVNDPSLFKDGVKAMLQQNPTFPIEKFFLNIRQYVESGFSFLQEKEVAPACSV